MKTVLVSSREEKIRKISAIIHKLYCFTSAEIDEYIARVKDFPDDGLDKMIALLEQGKKQQDELLARRVGEDKNYLYDLGKFLNKTAVKIKNKWEESESKKAEDLLYDI